MRKEDTNASLFFVDLKENIKCVATWVQKNKNTEFVWSTIWGKNLLLLKWFY